MTQPDRSGERVRSWTVPIALGLALAVALAFFPAAGHGFVNWDDEDNFTSNVDFGPLSWEHLRWAWTTFRVGVYQPFAWMLLEAEASLWGLDAKGYHAASLLLHAANAVLLYRLCVTLIGRCSQGPSALDPRAIRAGAGLAALLFAVHPLRVEVVAWASCQPYLPSIGCAILATLAYLRAHPSGASTSRGWLAASWLGFGAALLFKVEPAALPAVFLVLDVYPLKRLGPGRWMSRPVWLEKVPFVALGMAFLGVAAVARGVLNGPDTARTFDPLAKLAQACYSLGFYPAKTLWPARLSLFYGMPSRVELAAWPFWPATLAVGGAAVAAFALRRRWPGVAATLAAYLALAIPHLGLVATGPVIAADRYGYLASIPWAVLLAGGLAWLIATGKIGRTVAVASALGGAVVLAGLSREQCRPWGSSEILLRRALERGGERSPEIRAALGLALLRSGRADEAVRLCEEALTLDPDYFQAHFHLGLIRAGQGDLASAERHFAEGVRLDPDDRDAHYNLATSLARRGQMAEAIRHFDRALALRPFADTAFSLGILLGEQGRLEEAADRYELALRLRPDHAATHNNLGAVLINLGRYREAEAHFLEALRLRPDYPQARQGLEFAGRKLGRTP